MRDPDHMRLSPAESRNHFASIYDSFDERVRVVSRFLKEGLDRNERCVYLDADSEISAITSSLHRLGISIDLIDPTGLRPDRLLHRFQAELDKSIAAGFGGMRWAADMGWIVRLEAPEQSLLECEVVVDGFAHSHPVTYLCMFSRENFLNQIVSGVLRTHPALILAGEIYEFNPYYEPGDLPLASNGARRAEWALKQVVDLQELKRALGHMHTHELFLHRLSHELKTPMTTILGWCNLIDARKVSPDQLAQAIDAIKRNADLQNRLIEELMDASRLASGKLTLNRRPVRLAHLLLDFIESFAPVFQSKKVDLTCGFDVSPMTISVDPIRLQQIVGNLLTNALKFTPPEGRVSVDLASDNSEAVITIRDTGTGIRSELLPRIFDRFAQSESSKALGGLGLGLSIVRDLVTLHGGTVKIESPGEGRGTMVRIGLPVDQSADLDMPNQNAASIA